MSLLPGVVISGIMIGGIYALIALGFVLIFKSSHIFNLAQGEFLLFGACIGWTFAAALDLNFWLALICTIFTCAILGSLLERMVMRSLIGQPLLSVIMVTIALSMLIKGILIGVWWKAPYGYPSGGLLEPIIISKQLLDITIDPQFLMAFLAACVLIIVFLIFFKYAKLGLGMRAVAEDHQVAQSLGIPVKRVYNLTWAIAAVVAGIGGVFLGKMLTVSPELARLGLIVLPVAILGGLDSVPGCIVGGVIIGVAENVTAVYLDPLLPHSGGLRMVIPYFLMLIVLIIRPHGLFGLERIERI